MYSHKRSFTGQSTRSIASLFDLPFLATALIINIIFSIAHSFATYSKLHLHIRAFPSAIQNIEPEQLTAALKYTASAFHLNQIASLFIGLTLPLILISVSVRFALAPLRVSVQRTVTSCYLIVFYLCSILVVALQQPEWTPGNILLIIARPFGKEFFESVRAILCLSLIVATAVTLARNATSKANRRIRVVSFVIFAAALLSAEHLITENKRRIHPSFLNSPSSAKFIYIMPELTKTDVQKAFENNAIEPLKQQLTSFQEIEASTSSYAGQFATTFLGEEPVTHGIRHDQFGEDLRLNVSEALSKRAFQDSGMLYVANIGGTTSTARLFALETTGQRCDSSLEQLAAIGQFQASVLPYSLLPRYLDRLFHPELACTSRFMDAEQHLLHLHQKLAVELQKAGNKTFIIWVSESLKKTLLRNSSLNAEKENSLTSTLLAMHSQFLDLTGLKKYHQTYIVGLSGPQSSSTVFARFDGQAQSKLTDLTLEFPGLRSQASVFSLFKPDKIDNSMESPFFYSEYDSEPNKKTASTIIPRITLIPDDRKARLTVNHAELRTALTNGPRHITCKNVVGQEIEQLSLIKVTLTTHPTNSRLPLLTYQTFPVQKPSGMTLQVSLSKCLDSARVELINSLYKDISLRDSSAFRTLLAGLPVQPIQAQPMQADNSISQEKEIDAQTSELPAQPAEDMEF